MKRKRMKQIIVATSLSTLFALTTFAPGASAELTFCPEGSGAGQCKNPQGIAVDHETRRIYVADRGNHRVNIFELSPAGDEADFISAFGWGVQNGESEFQVCAAGCKAGISGSGLGQFSNPNQIAVDNTVGSANRHAVYVMDANRRLQKFDVEPEPVTAVWVSPTPSGTGPCQLARDNDPIAVGPAGVVYAADLVSKGSDEFTNRILKFNPDTGVCSGETVLSVVSSRFLDTLAVDAAGNAFVTFEGGGIFTALRKYGPSGELLEQLDELEVDDIETNTLSIDAAGKLFAAQRNEGVPFALSRVITEYGSSGEPLIRFGYGTLPIGVPGIAVLHTSGGDVFANVGAAGIKYLKLPADNRPIVIPEPCEANPLGNTKATLNAFANPEGKATTVKFEYITDADFIENGDSFSGPKPAASTPESDPIGSDFLAHKASAQISDLTPETKYRCRVVATNADGSAVGVEGTFTTLDALEIGGTWASEVGTEAATLNATVNPLGIPATGYFEYVEETTFAESGFDKATKAPAGEPIEFGAGESFKAGSAEIIGLSPGTAYRYRIVATDDRIAPKEVPGPTRSFRTYRPGIEGSELPDERAWELVSPAQKNSAEVAIPGQAGGVLQGDYVRIQAAAGSGEAITYTSWTSFAEGEVAPATNQYLARRSASGWQTENISPSNFGGEPLIQANVIFPPYRGFSPDLDFAGLVMGEAKTPGEVGSNFYLRDNSAGALSEATPEAPVLVNPSPFVCIDYAGASADGKRVFFAANASYAGAPVAEESNFNLYEWSAAEGVRLVSVLPNGNPAAPTDGTAFGVGGLHCSAGIKVSRNVVSPDGSRVLWTYDPPSNSSPTQLFARIGGEETIQLDKKVSGAGSPGDGVFLAASTDGSKVFFTSKNKLITGAGEGDLYLYDFNAEAPLKDLTPGGAGVKGMVGISDDGSHAYFAASAVLSGEEENEAGQKAQAGENNLYLWREGQIDFVAVLGNGPPDTDVWAPGPVRLRARVTPDGRNLAFLSSRAKELAGYDNTVAEGAQCRLLASENPGPLCPQAFVYDAEAETITCASCNPSGARPTGPSALPGWSNPLEGPRYLSDDGQRLFFETLDALLPQDENGKRDVYEFELEGSGSCTSQSPSFDSVSGGCHYLISSGKSTDSTYLLDASSDGRDVFFSTRSPLVGWDTNDNYDVYDAREGGGFPEPEEPRLCSGEGCKEPVPAAPPASQSPGTLSFQGQGNVREGRPRCRKGKVRRRGRCVKQRQRGAKRKGAKRGQR